MALVHLYVLFDSAQLPELRFNAYAFGVRSIHNPFCNGDVFLKRLVARVDHDGAVKARRNTIVTSFLVAMVKMDGKNHRGKHGLGSADHRFEHSLIGIFACAFRELNNKWGLALFAPAEQPEELFNVVDVIGANGVLTVGNFVELSSGDDHEKVEELMLNES